MDETDQLQIEDGTAKKGGMMPLILALVVVTLVGGGGGVAMGFLLGGSNAPAETADAKAADKAAAPDGHAAAPEGEKASSGHDKPAAGAHGEETLAEVSAEEEKPLQVVALKPVLTNLYNPSGTWIRIEASIILRQDDEIDPTVLAAEIEADTLTFARSLQIAQIEGTRGLLHLRDDLRERAKLRSPAIVDYLIQAMVVE
ncbi:hypothetical protein DYI37_13730 [Fulvimarina endophytica]|uniref:Flagellar protein FliL n=1 Tax=Fulvimarina endophytica TaxID=2293836 RepID=A0A371X199_9HYPH|nr:flagellar basal body-associated FliL family protein [Fulvimarina endophytica]RFC63001.1 hypothetical protein DYI37_13730 [Fulvimarina endophytica]